jgi:hypothetical protein
MAGFYPTYKHPMTMKVQVRCHEFEKADQMEVENVLFSF